jgi:hypothetical protein
MGIFRNFTEETSSATAPAEEKHGCRSELEVDERGMSVQNIVSWSLACDTLIPSCHHVDAVDAFSLLPSLPESSRSKFFSSYLFSLTRSEFIIQFCFVLVFFYIYIYIYIVNENRQLQVECST